MNTLIEILVLFLPVLLVAGAIGLGPKVVKFLANRRPVKRIGYHYH